MYLTQSSPYKYIQYYYLLKMILKRLKQNNVNFFILLQTLINSHKIFCILWFAKQNWKELHFNWIKSAVFIIIKVVLVTLLTRTRRIQIKIPITLESNLKHLCGASFESNIDNTFIETVSYSNVCSRLS